jgi:hypothetical protein
MPVWTTWRSDNSYPHRHLNSDSLVVRPVTSHYTDYANPAPCTLLKESNYVPDEHVTSILRVEE